MKIAFVADNEQTISAHFGRATSVVVVTVEDGAEVSRELRSKVGHSGHDHDHDHDHEHHHHHHEGGEGHGRGQGPGRGVSMGKFDTMQDCDVLIARGIGANAVNHAESRGMEVFLTDVHTVDEALAQYLAGELKHYPNRIHRH